MTAAHLAETRGNRSGIAHRSAPPTISSAAQHSSPTPDTHSKNILESFTLADPHRSTSTRETNPSGKVDGRHDPPRSEAARATSAPSPTRDPPPCTSGATRFRAPGSDGA